MGMTGDGSMALEELEALLSHPKVVLWLRELGIVAEDAHMLFDILDDGDGNITKKEFVNGVSKLKGEARAQDLVPVAANCERLLVVAKRTEVTCDRLAAIMHNNADRDGVLAKRTQNTCERLAAIMIKIADKKGVFGEPACEG